MQVPNASGSVFSRPIENSERVTWISVVSSVAIVESITAMIISLAPTPPPTTLTEGLEHVAELCSVIALAATRPC